MGKDYKHSMKNDNGSIKIGRNGYVINNKTVLKLMKQLGVQCFVRIKKYKII